MAKENIDVPAISKASACIAASRSTCRSSAAASLATVALVAFGGAAVLIVLQRKIWPAID